MKKSFKRNTRPIPLLVFVLILLSSLCCPKISYAQWVAGYTYRSKLTINGSQVCGSTAFANFPVLIQITSNKLKVTGSGGLVSNANGYDIIFTTSDQVTKIDHQIDHYTGTTGDYGAWVRIPSLPAGTDTDIYMYYGNSVVSSDPSLNTTWDTNFKTVYHFQNSNFNDATSYAINSTNNGTTNLTSAKIGDARAFDGSTQYIQSNSSELKTDNNFTVSVWFKATSTAASHLLWQGENTAPINGWGTNNPSGESEMNLSIGDCCPGNATVPNKLSWYLGDREEQVDVNVLDINTAFTDVTSWHYLAGTISNMSTGPTATFYLDGALIGTNTGIAETAGSVTDRSGWSTNLKIGRPNANQRFFNGSLDEVRISNIVRPANWICTEYNNQNSPSTFFTFANRAPDVSGIEATAINYTEDDAATTITSSITATDWDDNTFQSATVSITSGFVSTEDVLSFTNAFGVTFGSYSGGVLTLNGPASIANFVSALKTVTYTNTNNGNPSTATRTVSFQINDGTSLSNVVTRNIAISSRNDAPILSGTNNFTAINEDNTTSSGTLISTLISGQFTDADGTASSGIAVTAVDNTNGVWQYTTNGGTLWNNFGTPTAAASLLLASDANTFIRFVPNANWNGTATITYRAWDQTSVATAGTTTSTTSNGGTTAFSTTTASPSITVAAINDVPVFTKGADQTVNEDAGAQSVAGWATGISDGDPELTQTLTFNVSNDNNSLFSVQPSISAAGVLTYTPAANANGLATVTVTLSDNGSGVSPNVNTSGSQTFTITVAAINDVPVFTKGANQNVNEDAGAQSVAGWATSISDGDPELTQTLTFNASNDNNSLFSTQPSISAAGVLAYTPAANANGLATVTVTLSDNGSGISPNVNTSGSQTFTITVGAINDVPVFTKGADQSVNEDAGAQSVAGWATSISDGDPELTQVLTFNVSNNNNVLFSTQPSINATGDLTYTPAANANGVATVTVTLSDNGSGVSPNVNTSGSQTFTITVTALNDVPVFTKGVDQTVNEDAGAQSVAGWATSISDGDPELTQVLTFNVSNNNNVLFSTQPSISAAGVLTYTPAANGNGLATVTITLSDNGSGVSPNVNTSGSQTFTITVGAINDVPVFTKGADQNVNEDAGAQSASGWATGLSDGDPELTQTLTFNVSNNNNSLFSAQPSISAAGVLTYTPAANANGVATVTVTLSDNGSGVSPNVNTSGSQTFTITVGAINDVPVFTKGADQNVNEDAGAQSVSGWATGLSDGDPELAQTLTFNVSNDNNGLFSTQPSINATGDLTYTPAANANGVATVTVTLSDNGSGVSPNVNTSGSQTFTITVGAVNDEPSFVKGANQTILQNAPAQTVVGWATVLNKGAGNESGQILTFTVTNDNNALFTVQPSINPNTGDLTYTPAANINGIATVSIVLTDNGGTANGGDDTFTTQTFTIAISYVNNEPSFVKGSNQTVNEDAGAQTVVGWATSLNKGSASESGQTVTFTVTNDNNALFLVQPSINGTTGTLTYTPGVNANGLATVTVVLTDDGGTANGGDDTFATQTFTITVTALNDVPVFTKGADQTVNEDAGAQSVAGWATGISDGDPELTQVLTFNVSNNNNVLFSTQPSISAAGVLTYTPAANGNGLATVTITLSDNGSGVSPNVNTSGSQTFTITVGAINDVPVFTKGADQNVNEDAGAQSASGWATGLSDGDPELTQTLTFNVSNNNNVLFSTQPSINATGDLTYTPVANANGVATVTVTLSDNGSGVSPNVNTSGSQTFTITVGGINDVPVFTKGADQTVNEDAGAQSVAGWATSISDGDPELTQVLTFNVSNNNNVLFSTQPSINATGDLTYTPAADANGVATVTVTLSDNGSGVSPNVNTSGSQTFTITVSAVNDEPSFVKGANQTILQNAPAQTVVGWATVLNKGAGNESGQILTFTVTNDNNALFTVQPSINPVTGDLTYTPAANINGIATVSIVLTDNGGTANGGDDTFTTQTFTIAISYVNNEPSFVKGSNQTVNEDAGAQTVVGWATSLNKGSASESGQTVTFTVTNDNNALFLVQPSINGTTGTLTYTPGVNANGLATVTVVLTDDGGTANGGDDTFATQTFTITVTALNDVPVFTKGADQTVNEDAGAQSVSGWATGLNDGDPELTQTLTFNVSNDNNSLFSTQPSISAAGVLTYTPAANANGVATVTVTLSDNGSGVSPNVNTSGSQTFTITVGAINDVPVFTKGADQNVNEDAGAQSVSGWATGLSDGDPELTQTLTFNVSNDNNSLFSAQPSISAAGVLTYTPAANANGVTTVTVTLSDNGSGVSPNVNTSGSQTFTITVGGINDVPVFTKGADQTVNEDAGAQSVAGWATSISDGDPELTQVLTFNVSNNNNGLFSTQPSINATGDLTYTPAANANGVATVTVTLSDNGSGVSPNVNTSGSQTFTITVSAVNDEPSFVKGANQTILQNAPAQTVVGWATVLNEGAGNESGQILTFTVTNDNNALFTVQPSINPVTGDLTYTPAANINGIATVSIVLTDNGGTANGGDDTFTTETFTITVTALNIPPVAANDNASTQENIAIIIDVLANDNATAVKPFTITIVNNPSNGSLSINNTTGDITYTPNAGYFGSDSFTYTISDATGLLSNVATVNVVITALNKAPIAVDDSLIYASVLPLTIDVLANDSDPDNTISELTIISVTSPTFGSVSIENGKIVYRPSGDVSGTVTFTYTIQDPQGLTDDATVTIEYMYNPLKVSEGFSPNNDGNNDTWYIRSIEEYSNNSIKIFDRWGIMVYQIRRYDNVSIVWDGRANTGIQSGTHLGEGTYYYTLDLGDGSKILSGFVEIVR